MLEVFLLNAVDTVGRAVYKFLPKSIQRQIDPDSILGQAISVVFGVVILIGVATIIYTLR